SIERAARLLAGHGAGFGADPGLAWLGLDGTVPPPPWEEEPDWRVEGLRGWRRGPAHGVLRTGPLRFRPGQADLLHFELRDGPLALLRDGGTGSYAAPPGEAWWHAHFTGTAAHNTIAFDGEDQMPRLGRFLFARWPRTWPLPEGAGLRDHRGRVQEREVRAEGRRWTIEDRLSGRFGAVALRWRLAPGPWEVRPDGAVGPWARLALSADAPLAVTLEQGWESPAYGVVRPVPVLVARAMVPVSRITTVVALT
ncbi:MAG TPA: heparinase II/III family protein, partial [Crenalkalicoccus sp.]|nr:heparinase II/III family protein [Crenalkalicoccus sp.]